MTMKKYIILMVLCLLWFPVHAQTKAEADSAYASEQYDKAIDIYTKLLKNGEHAAIYYNLGNCYYRTGQMADAILNYERALLLQPGNGDIRFNLDLARSKTVDKIVPESEMFFVTWMKSLVNLSSADGWARTGIVAFILMGLLVMLYLFAQKIAYKKLGFFGALAMLVVLVLVNVFAAYQSRRIKDRTGAVIMATSVEVKSTPNESGTVLFVLHEGTHVERVDQSMKDWKEIRLSDGKVGWLPSNSMEVI